MGKLSGPCSTEVTRNSLGWVGGVNGRSEMDELFEERAAIMEYLGNQTREEAERNARKDIEEMRKHATTER